MWIDANGISSVLMISKNQAYKIIRQLKAEQEEKGIYVNPNAKIPVKFFCERFDLDENEVRTIVNGEKKSALIGA